MRIAIYTAITGNFPNQLRAPLVALGKGVDLICFTDCIWKAPAPWQLRPPAWEHDNDPRRTARYHKLLPHRILPDYDYWIWMDGNQQIAEKPKDLIEAYSIHDRYMFGSYQHPQRLKLSEELKACIRLKKDDPAVMRRQVARYTDADFLAEHRLIESTVVFRRNCERIHALNEAWWAELSIYSLRDQLSLNWVLHALSIPTTYIRGTRDKPAHFKYYPHR
jgi:hypothetical protein